MTASTDGFTSPTLKHVRESWWDDDFTEFLKETLKPRSGNRILDVGCGEGLAQVNIGRLHISQIRLVGIDLVVSKVTQARQKTASHNLRAGFAAADACHLPFVDGAFDSLFCVAVLQHIGDVRSALGEFARVTARHGRIVAVEPDNSERYVFSSIPTGRHAFEQAEKFFEVVTAARGEKTDASIGPKLPSLLAEHGIEPIAVRLFPVSHTTLGPLPAHVWATRRDAIRGAMKQVSSAAARDAGQTYLDALDIYEADAAKAGPTFVEIQNTMLFAAVGQRT
jgi:SAM-dependent methyltransferase